MDLKKEQELADRNRNESNEQADEITNSNNAIKKLINKFRKRSIDSRAETDGTHNSTDNIGTNQTGTSNIININQQSSSSASSYKSGSTLALPSSVSGTKMITIVENNESKGISPFLIKKNLGAFKLPELPPLNEATSVKQRWNILLSKAKGGVENIPKAFLSCSEGNQSVNSNMNTALLELNRDEISQNFVQKDESNRLQLKTTSESSSLLNPIIVMSSTNNETERLSIRSKLSCNTPAYHLEESGGFFHDIDRFENERLIKSTRNDDGLNKSPQKLIKSLIEYRQTLNVEIEEINTKISKVDKKICEILQLISSSEINNKGLYLSPGLKQKAYLLDIHSHRDPIMDSSFSFGLNSNLQLSNLNPDNIKIDCSSQHTNIISQPTIIPSMSAISDINSIKMRPKRTQMLDGNSDYINNKTETNLSIERALSRNQLNFGSNQSIVQPTITINEIRTSPRTLYTNRSVNESKKERLSLNRLKKDVLGGSNTSTIAAAVAGASSILTAVSANRAFTSTSNYNVNLIPIVDKERKFLTTSASDNIIKDTHFRKIADEESDDKIKLSSKVHKHSNRK